MKVIVKYILDIGLLYEHRIYRLPENYYCSNTCTIDNIDFMLKSVQIIGNEIYVVYYETIKEL